MYKVVSVQLNNITLNPVNVNLLPTLEREHLREEMQRLGPEKTPPIIVCPHRRGYMLIDGEQRWQIARELGWSKILAVIINVSEVEAVRLSTSYNKIRGTVDWFKVYDLLQKYGEDILEGILSGEELENVKKLGELDEWARNRFIKAWLNGVKLTLEQVATVASTYQQLPPEKRVEGVEGMIRTQTTPASYERWVQKVLASIKEIKVENGAYGPLAMEDEREVEKRLRTKKEKTEREQGEHALIRAERKLPETTPVQVEEQVLRCPCGRLYYVSYRRREIFEAEKAREGGLMMRGCREAEIYDNVQTVRCPRCGYVKELNNLYDRKAATFTCECDTKAEVDIAAKICRWHWKAS